MNGGIQEPHQTLPQDYNLASYPQSFQAQPSSRPSSQPPQSIMATNQRIQQSHQALNPNNLTNLPPTPHQIYPQSHPHPQQQFVPFQASSVPSNQPKFQPHPSSQQHPILAHNSPHVYGKVAPAQHQVAPNSTISPMVRPSQHQIAQHLMNPQAHMRSQRMMQQQQLQQQQRFEEIMMTCDPLDCFTNRNMALRRYTNNHINMNSILGTHWTINQLLKEDHIRLASKRKNIDSTPSDSIEQRKERLRQKIKEIEKDIKTFT